MLEVSSQHLPHRLAALHRFHLYMGKQVWVLKETGTPTMTQCLHQVATARWENQFDLAAKTAHEHMPFELVQVQAQNAQLACYGLQAAHAQGPSVGMCAPGDERGHRESTQICGE